MTAEPTFDPHAPLAGAARSVGLRADAELARPGRRTT